MRDAGSDFEVCGNVKSSGGRFFMKTLEAGKRIGLKNILFATDFSPYSNAALPYALAIARQYGAKLYGIHALASEAYCLATPDYWPGYVQQEEELQQEAAARLEEQIRGVPHQVVSVIGDVWDILSRLVGEHDIDLIVVGTHGRTGARKLLMGSVAERIFRQAACPVLTVGPNVPCKENGAGQFRKILFATDFSKESLAALSYAFSLAEEDQSQLALLHVVEQPAAGIVDVEGLTASLVRRLKQLTSAEVESWCDVQCLVGFSRQFAPPAERILEIARERAEDLIVLGVRPTHGAFSTVTHLSHTTAQHIVAHATCPVLTIRG
jgi:nucleotide-binding universal stress UspA family protein